MNIQKRYTLSIDPEKADIYTSDADILYHKKVNGTDYWFINGIQTPCTVGPLDAINHQIPTQSSFLEITDLKNTNWDEKFHILEQRLNNINKELTAWDIYKIKADIKDGDDIEAKFAELNFGESLIYNSRYPYVYTINSGEESTSYTLSSGDLIIKTLDGNAIIVEALSKGIYYPSLIEKNENTHQYNITYSFSEQTPESGSISRDIGQTAEIPYQSIVFNNLEDNATRQPYNAQYPIPTSGVDSGKVSFPVLSYRENNTTKDIYPVIKIYNESNEEIYADFTLTKSDTQWLFQTDAYTLNPNKIYYITVK